MKKFIIIADFNQGMIDSVKPDTNYENAMQSPSVQWLENLNPNVLISGLIHRDGFVVAKLSKSSEVEKNSNGEYYGCNEFVDLIKKRYVSSTDNPDDYLLFSVPVKIINPKNSNAWFLFVCVKTIIDGIEYQVTRPVGYYCILEYDPLDKITGESWKWIEPTVDKLRSAGRTMYVKALDYAIRGQNILTVGIPDLATYEKFQLEISPIYIWGFENLRKSKSLFLPDIDQWTEHDKQKWKVLSNSKMLQDITSLIRLLPLSSVLESRVGDCEGWTRGQAEFPTGLGKNKYLENNIYSSIRQGLDLVVWQSRVLPKYSSRTNADAQFVHIGGIPPDDAHLWMRPWREGKLPFNADTPLLWQFEDIRTDKTMLSAHVEYSLPNGSNTYYRGIKTYTTFNFDKTKVPEYIRVGGYGSGELHETFPQNLNNINSLFVSTEKYDNLKDNFDSGDMPYYSRMLLCANYLFNYNKLGIPRMWCYGEKIPYVLTIVVNGVETILKEDSFHVFGANNLCKPKTTTQYYPSIMSYASDTVVDDEDYMYQWAWNKYDAPYITFRPVDDSVKEDVWFAEKLGITSYRGSWVQGFNLQCMAAYKPFIYFTLRFNTHNKDSFYNFIPEGATDIRLYVSLPDNGHPIIKDRFGVEGIYGSNLAKKQTGNTEYALVKIFPLVKPVDEKIGCTENDFKAFTRSSQGDTAVDDGKWVYLEPSVVVESDDIPTVQAACSGGKGWYFVPNDYSDTTFIHSNMSFSPPPYNSPIPIDDRWTPDFCLWDYPEGQLLADNLGGAVKLWKGSGARLIEVIKGQPFIAGCMGPDRLEETGRIRYTIKQKTNISNDQFAENDFLTLGKFPHTALVSFREQLWAFSRYQVHRVQFHDIYDSFKYEVLEAMEGQGTFNIKTVCAGQEGVYWCNEHGIWFSDGRAPQTISDGVASTYSILSARRQFELTRDYISIDPEDMIDDVNSTLELNYDSLHNEVVLSSKVIVPEAVRERFKLSANKKEFKLVYSVKNKNWRIESLFLIPNIHTVSVVNKLKTPLEQPYDTRLLVDGDRHILSFGVKDQGTINDSFIRSKNDTTRTTTDVSCDFLMDLGELGNGVDDYLFGSAKIEVEPFRFKEYTTTPPSDLQYDCTATDSKDYCDPALLLDNKSGVADITHYNIAPVDIVAKNFGNKTGKCIYVGPASTPSELNKEVTSLNLQSPIIKYRHLRVWLKGKNAKVVRSITLFYNDMKRKFFT